MNHVDSCPHDYMSVVADHLPSMLAYWDKELRCRYANRAYEQWFGADPDALIGTSIKDLLGPELFGKNEPYILAVLDGKEQSFERFVPHPDGGGRHSLAVYLPHRVDGSVAGFMVQVTDVSPLKSTEASLRAEITGHQLALARLRSSEAALLQAQRLGQIGSWEWEIRTDIVTWSEELYRIFGLDPGRLPPSYAEHDRIYTPDSLVALRSAVERARTRGDAYRLELQYIRPDGLTGWIEARGEAVQDASGATVALRGIAQEISARRELEAVRAERDAANESSRALLERELKDTSIFQALVEQGPYFATVLALDGTVVDSNLAEQASLCRQGDVIGRKFWECSWWNRSADVIGCVRQGVERAARGIGTRQETSLFAADGARRLCDLIVVPIRDDKARVMFVAAVGVDISDRQQAEEELRRLAVRLAGIDKQKETFLATLAHEMLNLLSPVHSGLHLLKRTTGAPPAVDRVRHTMSRQIDHLSRLVGDLFDIARINSGKLTLECELVDIDSVLERSLEIALPALSSVRIAPVKRVPIAPIIVPVDPMRMAQVFANFLNNAAKFTPAGGRVEVAAGIAENEAVVTISDNGIGMAAADLERVFQMFAQVPRVDGSATAGLGVGLAAARSIVHAHGGRVEASSDGPGRGSTFTVRLPL